jgi:hypothetical protein
MIAVIAMIAATATLGAGLKLEVNAAELATVQIRTGSSWSGPVMDSGLDMVTYDGHSDRDIQIECDYGSVFGYSVVIQKMQDSGFLTVNIVKDGSVIDTGTTSAAYGLVTLAGSC